MTKTRDDIARRALLELRVIENGQAASAEDIDAVDVTASVETLAAMRYVDVTAPLAGDDGAIGDEWLIPLGLYVAGDHASAFGYSQQEAEMMRQRGLDLIQKIANRAKPVSPLVLETVRLGLSRHMPNT
jgi:hypothetical protein